MIKKAKPSTFVQKSYDRSNKNAIALYSDHLALLGYEVKTKEDEDYGIDIEAIKDGVTEYFEVETKRKYDLSSVEKYKFKQVHFLARKSKWQSIGFWYVLIEPENFTFIKGHSSVIFKGVRKRLYIHSAERRGYEHFYFVAKEKCEFGKLARP